MTTIPHLRSAIAQAALAFVPPLIRRTLLEEAAFRKEYGLKTSVVLSLGDSVAFVQRSELFGAVRRILSGVPAIEVPDITGKNWELKNTGAYGEAPSLILSCGEQHLVLPDFAGLSADSTMRLHFFDETASKVNLPSSARASWRTIIAKRSLEDDEFEAFQSEFRDMPISVEQSIRNIVTRGQPIEISTLVPVSRRYFERLIGAYDSSTSIRDYAAGSCKEHLEQLSNWRAYDGFLFSLLLSSHSSITALVGANHLNNEDLVRAFDFVEQQGDITSQLGAVEVGLRILSSRPEIEPILIRLIKQIRDDDVDKPNSNFNLLSALFLLVDGELSRTRLLSAEPPFYRRFAALSQAALIHRQLVQSNVDMAQFFEWAYNNRGEQYYFQSFTDMRVEPRWHPDFAAASQMKADFFGRIMNAAKEHEQNIRNEELADLVLRNKPGSLIYLSDPLRPYLPGPLEGAEESQISLPSEISEAIKVQLSAEELTPSSFIGIVNLAPFLRAGADTAELAAKALKLGSYRLADVKDRSQLLAILNGLAIASAITRSRALANDLRILVRRYRRDAQFALSIDEVLRVCLVAAACHAEMVAWRDFVGDWLTELAFSDLEGDDGSALYSHLRCLFLAVPELWMSCGKAYAALRAYNAAQHPV